MKLSRRLLLQGLGAGVALPALPKVSLALPHPRADDIKMIKDHFAYYFDWEERVALEQGWNPINVKDYHKVCNAICNRMVDLDPDWFLDKTMFGPTSMAMYPRVSGLDADDYEFFTLCSMTRNYKLDSSEEEYNFDNVDRLAREALKEQRDYLTLTQNILDQREQKMWDGRWNRHLYERNGNKVEFYNYLPVVPVRAVRPDTFKPFIGFKWRGTISVGGATSHMTTANLRIENEKHRRIWGT